MNHGAEKLHRDDKYERDEQSGKNGAKGVQS